MLLGLVVLVEVDAGSVVVLHGVAGQQLSEERRFHSVSIHPPAPFYHLDFEIKGTFPPTHGCGAAARGRAPPRLIRRVAVSIKTFKEPRTYLTKLSTCDMDAS